MLIDHQQLTGSTSSGSLAKNTAYIRGLVREVIVKPATETTIYDVKITNPLSANIYERTSETGSLAEINSIPVNGIYTVTISNATKDEAFTIQLITQE